MEESHSEDILMLLGRRNWSAEDMLLKVRLLATKLNDLDEPTKSNVPRFSGDWSLGGVTAFIEKYSESIKNPIRHRNKERLEELGITTKGITEEILEDSIGVAELTDTLKGLDVDSPLVRFLVESGIVPGWIRLGFDSCKKGLQHASIARTALNSILQNCEDKQLRDLLMHKSITDPNSLEESESILLQVNSLSTHGVLVSTPTNLEGFAKRLGGIYQTWNSLVDDYGFSQNDLDAEVRGKNLDDTEKLLKDAIENARKTEERLREERKMYADTLVSLGRDVATSPSKYSDLKEDVETLRLECLEGLGKGGMAILTFLQGEGSLPADVSIEELKKALQIMRPLFLRNIRQEPSTG